MTGFEQVVVMGKALEVTSGTDCPRNLRSTAPSSRVPCGLVGWSGRRRRRGSRCRRRCCRRRRGCRCRRGRCRWRRSCRRRRRIGRRSSVARRCGLRCHGCRRRGIRCHGEKRPRVVLRRRVRTWCRRRHLAWGGTLVRKDRIQVESHGVFHGAMGRRVGRRIDGPGVGTKNRGAGGVRAGRHVAAQLGGDVFFWFREKKEVGELESEQRAQITIRRIRSEIFDFRWMHMEDQSAQVYSISSYSMCRTIRFTVSPIHLNSSVELPPEKRALWTLS